MLGQEQPAEEEEDREEVSSDVRRSFVGTGRGAGMSLRNTAPM